MGSPPPVFPTMKPSGAVALKRPQPVTFFLTRMVNALEASIDKVFRSAAVRIPPHAPAYDGKGRRGLARRVKRVCASFCNASLTKGCRTHWRQPSVKTRTPFIQTIGHRYLQALFGRVSASETSRPKASRRSLHHGFRRHGQNRQRTILPWVQPACSAHRFDFIESGTSTGPPI
jgi:hypothetical protein